MKAVGEAVELSEYMTVNSEGVPALMRDTKDGIIDRGIGIKHGNTFDLHPQAHWRCIIFAMMVVVAPHL